MGALVGAMEPGEMAGRAMMDFIEGTELGEAAVMTTTTGGGDAAGAARTRTTSLATRAQETFSSTGGVQTVRRVERGEG